MLLRLPFSFLLFLQKLPLLSFEYRTLLHRFKYKSQFMYIILFLSFLVHNF